MNIDFRVHYWPNTPELREIKLVIDGNVIQSSFMSINQVVDLSERLKNLQSMLAGVVDDIYTGND